MLKYFNTELNDQIGIVDYVAQQFLDIKEYILDNYFRYLE